MRRIVTAVAAIALAAGAAQAQGNGNGKSNDRGGGHGNDHAAGASMQGGGNGNRGNGNGNANRGGDAPDKDRGNSGQAPAERGNQGERGNGNGNAGRGPDQRAVQADRGRGNDNRSVADSGGRGNDDRRTVVIDNRGRDRDVVVREVERVRDFRTIPTRGLVTGCPPGLAKKNPPCVPPGQVRSPFRDYDRPDFWGLPWLGDGRYRYDDGYLVRLAPDGRIGSYVPLLGGALSIGNIWPTYYEPVALPTYYESYYGLGQYDSYRYADNVIYQVDPQTDAITSVLALLTGDDFAVGQRMPAGYDVYNVPYGYRDQYYDTPEAMYRYSDGYVYQIDPTTQLIAAAIELIS